MGGFPMLCAIFFAKSEQAILMKFRHQYNLKLLRSQIPIMCLDLILWTFWSKCMHKSYFSPLKINSIQIPQGISRGIIIQKISWSFSIILGMNSRKNLRKFRKKDTRFWSNTMIDKMVANQNLLFYFLSLFLFIFLFFFIFYICCIG